MAKVFTLLQRRHGWSRTEFRDYWSNTHKEHALDLARAGFFSGYVQNHLLEPAGDPAWPVADGIPEIWVPSINSLAEIAQSDIYREGAAQDEPNFTSGEIASYICAQDCGLEVSGRVVRHLILLQVNTREPVIACLERHGLADVSDVIELVAATDKAQRCVMISCLWAGLDSARDAVDVMTRELNKAGEISVLNAGLYEPVVVVHPQTGKLNEA